MSRQELAEIVNAVVARDYDRQAVLDATYIGKLERGEHRWPNDQYRAAFRTVLGARSDADLGFYVIRSTANINADALQLATTSGPFGAETVSDPNADPHDQYLCGHANVNDAKVQAGHPGEDVVDVLARVHKLNRNIDPAIINTLKGSLQHTLAHYDAADHPRLTTTLVKQRAWLDTLLDGCHHPRQRQQLFEVAGLTSGLLGYLAVGKASYGLARAYCLEAFRLASFAQDANLRTWARGMQSFCEYYFGDYKTALHLALDGIASAEIEPQVVRLTINGAARASGKLGEVKGVRLAVDKAYDLMAHHDVPAGVPSSIALGCYSSAQVASNAATAFVSLGMPTEVQHYVDLAMPDISRSGPPWSRSLVMLDLGSSLIRSNNADLEHATDLVLDALRISHGRPIISVQQRASEFVRDATARWGYTRQMNSIKEALAAMGDHQ